MRKLFVYSFSFLLLLFFLAEFFHPITAINVDLGRHLLLGKIIVSTKQVSHTNLLSYTYPDFPYINTSWLFEIIYYFLFTAGGFNLLLIVNTFLIAFAFGLLVFKTIKINGITFATLFGITFYLLLLGFRPDIRPEVMSMVCLSLFIVILYSVEKIDKKLLLLIPIELLWVNLHIYFFVGPLLVFLVFLDYLFRNHFNFAKAKYYFFILVGTLIATCINPNGIKAAIYPFTVLNNYGFPIIENQSIPTLFTIYHSSKILLPVIAIVLLFIVLFLARKNTKPIEWMLAIIFSLASFFIFRNILLFVFTTFLSFTIQLNFLAKKYRVLLEKLPKLLVSFCCFLSFLFMILFIVISIATNGFGLGVSASGENAVDFLKANNIQGPIYNNFDIGDYLVYRIYPQRVFVENRPEAYPASFFQNTYIPMQNNPEIFKKIDRQYKFNAIVISYWDSTPWGSMLLQYLVNNSNFKLIYLDPFTIILVRNTYVNKKVIAKNLITRESFKSANYSNTEILIHYLFFFEKVGWSGNVKTILSHLQLADPQLCILTQYPLAKTYIEKFILEHRLQKNCSLLISP